METRIPATAPLAPHEPELTEYDRMQFPLYARLLDAAEAGAPWTEATAIVLGLDPAMDPEGAKRAYDSHLARARWMMDQGYRDLLRQTS